MSLESEHLARLTCVTCSYVTECDDDVEGIEHHVWDHLGKYEETPNDHVIEVTTFTRWRFV